MAAIIHVSYMLYGLLRWLPEKVLDCIISEGVIHTQSCMSLLVNEGSLYILVGREELKKVSKLRVKKVRPGQKNPKKMHLKASRRLKFFTSIFNGWTGLLLSIKPWCRANTTNETF